jgi:hypothetical protein
MARYQISIRQLGCVLIVAALLLTVRPIAIFVLWPNSIQVLNSTDSTVTDVTLNLLSTDGKWNFARSIKRLGPGQSIIVRHNKNDTAAELTYSIDGRANTFREPYIDLWKDERWVFVLEQSGLVVSDYGQSWRTEYGLVDGGCD